MNDRHDERASCPRCGAPLAEGGVLSGLCPACLLRQGVGDPAPFLHDAARPSGAEVELSAIQRDFPQFEILELVGRGGMGLVYKARQPRLDRTVALKILAPEVMSQPAFAERFLREARALARLNHPNVVAVHDFGEVNGRYFLVMEYVEGAHLRQLIELGRLRAADALRLVPEICAGLQYAHEQGIVHRDIKPENILVDANGRPKIADFGLVKVLGQDEDDWRLTRASQVMGTPQYMAPEQMHRPRDVDHRADIYSLGVVLYEMLTAELPVGRFALPSERARVDARLDDVVLKAMQREPAQRYQAASEMSTSVEDIAKNPRHNRERNVARDVVWPKGKRLNFLNKDKLDGIYELRGIIGVENEELVAEYRSQLLGIARSSKVETLRLPLKDLAVVSFKRGFLSCEIRITLRSLAHVEGFPSGPKGCLRFLFAKADAAEAERLARHLSLSLES